LVKRLKITKEQKIGGIIIPESAAKQDAENETGVVIAVGSGTKDHKTILKEGDKVLLPDYKGAQVKFEGEKFDLYSETEIVGIIQDK
jgi:chaperonin GroES